MTITKLLNDIRLTTPRSKVYCLIFIEIRDDSEIYNSLLLTPIIEVDEDKYQSTAKKISKDDYYCTPAKSIDEISEN